MSSKKMPVRAGSKALTSFSPWMILVAIAGAGLPLAIWAGAPGQPAAPAQPPELLAPDTPEAPAAEPAAPAGAPAIPAQPQAPAAVDPSTRPAFLDLEAVAKIREEGLKHSHVMEIASYLTDVIGPRLTGSPQLKRANEWTRDQLKGWGLENAQLEAWGNFGRGWDIKRFSAEVIEPLDFPIVAYPKAWLPGFDHPIETQAILLDPKSEEELQSYAGKLEGAIVLIGGERPVQPHFKAEGSRYTDEELQRMSRAGRGNAQLPLSIPNAQPAQPATQPTAPCAGAAGAAAGRGAAAGGAGPRSGAATRPAPPNASAILTFAFRQNAAIALTPSGSGDGGTMIVQSAASIGSATRGINAPGVWTSNAQPTIAQVTVATEHYNRLVRMLKAGEKVKMAINMQVQFYNDDPQAYNTIAEIPGTDLKDQIVMIGGHLDSWHSATGATDNGAGVAASMESVRILEALGVHPRRTIRIALWTGEEQGLYGSQAYVNKHFGTVAAAGRGAGGGGGGGGRGARGPVNVNKGPEYEKLSVYFNLDNGTGKIRGIYLQGNQNVRTIFSTWLAPFADLGATTLTIQNTGSTDHVAFDGIGLPGFQFIQDQIEYGSRTHHTSADSYDRLQPEDMKQASTIMAAFLYNAAMMDERMPRK